MARWAVFDVDGTLLPGFSMERRFIDYLLRRKKLPLKNLLTFVLKAWTAVWSKDGMTAVKANKYYLRKYPVAAIEREAETCFQRYIAPSFFKAGKQKIEWLRREGYKILIISGAPSFLARRLQNIYCPDYLICAELENNNGLYTGNLSGFYPYGQGKRILLEEIRAKLDLDFSQSIVFANHYSDIHHMKLFGRVVAVNPGFRLRRTAKKYGWQIVSWP